MSGFPQLLKNHWNSDLCQDHGKIIEFHEKLLKFVEMNKSLKNHWILDHSVMEKSLNSKIEIVLTNYMGKWIWILYIHYVLIYYSSNQAGRFLPIFLKAPNSLHKVCEEVMRNMWSCVFSVLWHSEFHGNSEILSWNIIEKSLKFFKACLWEPCMCIPANVRIYFHVAKSQ